MTSGQRPDVVPGNPIESAAIFDEPMASGLSPSEISNENSSNLAINQGLIFKFIYPSKILISNSG